MDSTNENDEKNSSSPTDVTPAEDENATIAPQAFTMLNSPIIRARALAFAARLEKERSGNLNEQIRRAFRLAHQRAPSKDEVRMCHEHIARSLAEHQTTEPVQVKPPRYVVRQMVEEMTGLVTHFQFRMV